MCYQNAATAIRRNSEFLNIGSNNGGCVVGGVDNGSNMSVPAGSRTPHEVNGGEPTNLSVKIPPADAQATTNQSNTGTRLSLREILQNNKPEECDDIQSNADDHHDNASHVDSFSENESDDDMGNKPEENGASLTMGAIMGNGESMSENGSDVQMKKSRVESIVSSIRAPSNGTSSPENSESIGGESRKTKRKQVYPKQQIDSDNGMVNEKDLWRKQLLMMQQQINVMQERYDNLPSFRGGGIKRQLDDIDGPAGGNDFMIPVIERGLENVQVSNEEVRKLAVLISAEIQEQINPIISSVLAKYIRKPKENAPPPAKNKARTRTPTPAPQAETPARSPSVASQAVRAVKIERTKQPVNQLPGEMVHTNKHFTPLYSMGFPPRPFFSNESKLGNDFFSMSHFAAAAMASAAPTMYNPHFQNFLRPGSTRNRQEAIPLVVSQKKKRHKVTDTRITPRVMSKVMNQKEELVSDNRKFLPSSPNAVNGAVHMGFSASSHPLLARSLATQSALNHSESSAFHPSGLDVSRTLLPAGGGNFYAHPGLDRRDVVSPTENSMENGSNDMNEQNSLDGSDSATEISGGRQPSAPFPSRGDSLTFAHSSTLTPMHLRKAKLMFFYTRYPNSATLKTFFPDIKFNKNNTAQLVKWFSNFREFYYIQMEKYARQALAEGLENADDIQVSKDCELYRTLNLHYNRNNHIEVPDAFREVVEETLKEFFKAIQVNRDQEPSWKKAIYKIINRMDDIIPEYFKSAHFLEQLE
ncbi:LOW QUALITY PROTEIN: uncharacterized protein LOC129586401 [Paramacrobiotus metropolitanus]|uniref:LOW QUALITY PROTEIN: uncharacterized protein LOC129586401 n=1 Tax=Paramacrobiotus metropolitanus TaxID=2943436 RepID=UPI002445E2EB|nr:LOW QUALITY PROTEIN: uncharacterized protein LOC129586401 [Paramacrobiotus metropolitanus]